MAPNKEILEDMSKRKFLTSGFKARDNRGMGIDKQELYQVEGAELNFSAWYTLFTLLLGNEESISNQLKNIKHANTQTKKRDRNDRKTPSRIRVHKQST